MFLDRFTLLMGKAGLGAAIITVCLASTSSADEIPQTDIEAYGGLLFLPWTSRSYEGHTSMVSLVATARARDVHYLVEVTSEGETRTLAEGDLKNLRKGDYQILTSQKQKIGDNSVITGCLTYYSIDEQRHFASISQFEEPAIIGDGGGRQCCRPIIRARSARQACT